MSGQVQLIDAAGWFERLYLKPYFGVVTTITGVLAGYLGSHYDGGVVESLSTIGVPISSLTPMWGAAIFWAMAALFGLSFGGTIWAQSKSAARSAAEVKKDALEIKQEALDIKKEALDINDRVQRLHTLPPIGFLETYRLLLTDSEPVYAFLIGQKSIEGEALDLGIRNQLATILQLVQAFDADGSKACYGINVMVFRRSVDLTLAEQEEVQERLRFIERSVSVDKLEGVLDLVCSFSASSDNEGAADANLSPMALPIPLKPESDEPLYGVLPGAPSAFISGDANVVASPESWADLANSEQFSGELRADIASFFSSESAWIQSLISLPLCPPATGDIETDAKREVFAVLNIHRDLPNLSWVQKLELLGPLLVPLTLRLRRLLWNSMPQVAILVSQEKKNEYASRQELQYRPQKPRTKGRAGRVGS